MDKILKIIKTLFAIIGIIVLLVALGLWYFYHSVVPKDDPVAKAQVDQWIPAIVQNWDENALKSHLAEHFTVELANAPASGQSDTTLSIKTDNIEEISKVFSQAKATLGVMKDYRNGATCHQGRDNKINCYASVKFEKGRPLVDVDMNNNNGEYKIVKFRIWNSDN